MTLDYYVWQRREAPIHSPWGWGFEVYNEYGGVIASGWRSTREKAEATAKRVIAEHGTKGDPFTSKPSTLE